MNLRKSDSASPDDAKSVQKKETSFWIASWHVCRSRRSTTDCDAHESGILPDAAVLQIRQEQQREQQAKRQLQQASQPQHKSWPLQQQSKQGTQYPPTLLQKRSHPPSLQMLPGKRNLTSP